MTAEAPASKHSVLIVGGGVAGLETLLALQELAEGRVQVALVSPEPDFTYKPMMVEEPFLTGVAEKRELAPIARELGARFIRQAVVSVRPNDHRIDLADGSSLSYEMLVVCAGGRLRAPYERAFTFPPAEGEPTRLNDWLRAAELNAGGKLAFVVPPGVTWPLPIYELALMTQRLARRGGLEDVQCTIVTPESAPLIMFGLVVSESVAQLLQSRGIDVQAGSHAREVGSRLVLSPGDRPLDADAVISLPLLEGPRIAGLPGDEKGFIPIDRHARVRGLEDVYAAGDGTTFPIKQGGIGTQQADAAAEHIAARAGAVLEPRPFRPVLRGKLLTGDESMSLRHEVTGGRGEGTASDDYLWWPPHKISGRYLAPWLAHVSGHEDPEPPRRALEVEVALPAEWHEQPMPGLPYDADRRADRTETEERKEA
jgi:sulfide:quinone oxidoreductase